MATLQSWDSIASVTAMLRQMLSLVSDTIHFRSDRVFVYQQLLILNPTRLMSFCRVFLLLVLSIFCGIARAIPVEFDTSFGTSGRIDLLNSSSGPFRHLRRDVNNGLIVVSDAGIWRVQADNVATVYVTTPGAIADAAIDATGRIVVAFQGGFVQRLLPDGKLDPTFNPAGFTFPLNANSFRAVGVALDAHDGAVLVGGDLELANGRSVPALIRFRANGALDTQYGAGTGFIISNSQAPATSWKLIQQPDGKLVILADASIQGVNGTVVARFTPTDVDPNFGRGGITSLPSGRLFRGGSIQPDGKLVLAGRTLDALAQFAVTRLQPDGSVDSTFGSNGEITLTFEDGTGAIPYAVGFDTQGRVLVVGTVADPAGYEVSMHRIGIARLTPNGMPDTSFAAHGTVSIWQGFGSSAYGLVVDPDGALTIAGEIDVGTFFIGVGGHWGRRTVSALYRVRINDSGSAKVVREGAAIEYFHSGFRHYFVTASPTEIALLDAIAAGQITDSPINGWVRTGSTFPVWTEPSASLAPVCRFFSVSFGPKSSHFYTAYPDECTTLKAGMTWQYEGIAFELSLPSGVLGRRTCPLGTAPLYRMYNNGLGGAPNHRYSDDPHVADEMISQGWVFEGEAETRVFACIPPNE